MKPPRCSAPTPSPAASLAVGQDEHASVAGRVTTVNGLVFVLGLSIRVGLYQIARPLPYWAAAAALALLLVVTMRRAASASRD